MEESDPSNPYIIGFQMFVHCLPIHKYVVDIAASIVIYYCGQNNTITLPLSYIETVIDKIT